MPSSKIPHHAKQTTETAQMKAGQQGKNQGHIRGRAFAYLMQSPNSSPSPKTQTPTQLHQNATNKSPTQWGKKKGQRKKNNDMEA